MEAEVEEPVKSKRARRVILASDRSKIKNEQKLLCHGQSIEKRNLFFN